MTFKENSDYTDLKKVVLSSIVGTNERYNRLLSTIKEKYRNHINSPRRYEQIGSIGELLRVLEIRDVLSVNNVEPLKEIANELENSNVLLEKINEYERNNVAPEFVNYYALQNIKSTPSQHTAPAETTFINNNPNKGMSTNKKQRIINTVVDNIGVFWKDLARCLDIKERVIDDLNDRYREVPQRAKHIMELYNEMADDNTWFFDLCDALENCRRKDLVRKLKKITLMNI